MYIPTTLYTVLATNFIKLQNHRLYRCIIIFHDRFMEDQVRDGLKRVSQVWVQVTLQRSHLAKLKNRLQQKPDLGDHYPDQDTQPISQVSESLSIPSRTHNQPHVKNLSFSSPGKQPTPTSQADTEGPVEDS